jgi:hypothetical protein
MRHIFIMNQTYNITNTNSSTNGTLGEEVVVGPRYDTIGIIFVVFFVYLLFIICGGCILARGVAKSITYATQKRETELVDLTPLEPLPQQTPEVTSKLPRPQQVKEYII